MFSGVVNIIERRKLLHCGIKVRATGKTMLVSACNQIWNANDKTYELPAEKVTCKRCIKILAKADENGKVNLQ